MQRLIRVFVGRTLSLLVLSCRGSCISATETLNMSFDTRTSGPKVRQDHKVSNLKNLKSLNNNFQSLRKKGICYRSSLNIPIQTSDFIIGIQICLNASICSAELIPRNPALRQNKWSTWRSVDRCQEAPSTWRYQTQTKHRTLKCNSHGSNVHNSYCCLLQTRRMSSTWILSKRYSHSWKQRPRKVCSSKGMTLTCPTLTGEFTVS